MLPLQAVLVILVAHFIADFCMQTERQANNKSKNNWILLEHVAEYTCMLVVSTVFLFDWYNPVSAWWPLFNGIAHYGTDWVTSRWTSRLYKQGKIRAFFRVIGLDQLVHFATLFASYVFFTSAFPR